MGRLSGIKRDASGRIPAIWDIDSAIKEAEKYKTKKDFRLGSSSAYQYLVKNKKIHLVILPGKRHRLSDWEIFCSLKKSKTWGDFRLSYPKEYTAFYKRKHFFDESCFSHLGLSKTAKRWTRDEIAREAKKYKHRSHFSKRAPGAYDAAQNYGILKDVCSHMVPLQSDFNCVYMWVSEKKNKKHLVKFGVTSKRLGKTRIEFVQAKAKIKAIEVIILEHPDALLVENKLKNIGVNAGLSGFSGCTEFYWLTCDEIRFAKEVLENGTIK